MNTCPQCHSVYADDFVYCLNDGTVLAAADREQETVLRPRMEVMALGGAVVTCSGCGYDNRAGSKFCKKCGGAILPSSSEPASPQFGFAAAGAAPAFVSEPAANQYEPTVTVTPGLFTPPRSDAINDGGRGPFRMQHVFYAGIGAAVVLVVGIVVVLMMKPPPPDNKNSNENKADSPKAFTNRQYTGTVQGPKGSTSLTMQLTRSGSDLSGYAYTNRGTDRVDGAIHDDGSFRLSAKDQKKGDVQTGYWSGTISTDSRSIDGQWTNLYDEQPAPFSVRQ